jgi:hypothetical protein
LFLCFFVVFIFFLSLFLLAPFLLCFFFPHLFFIFFFFSSCYKCYKGKPKCFAFLFIRYVLCFQVLIVF